MKVRTGLPKADLCNAVRGAFVDGAKNWQAGDFPPVTNAMYEDEDGEPLAKDVAFPFTTDSVLAQRLARIVLERARQGISVGFPGNFSLIRAAVMEPVRLTLPWLGWDRKAFLPVAWSFGPDGVDLELIEETAAIYDWNNGHPLTYDPAPDTSLPDPFTVRPPAWVTAEGFTDIGPDGGSRSMLRVRWGASPDAYVEHYAVQWREVGTDGGGGAWTGRVVPRDTLEDVSGPVRAGAGHDARVAAVNGMGRYSPWVSTGGAVAEPDTIPPGPPVNVMATGDARAIILRWQNDAAPDLAAVEVWGRAGGGVVEQATRLASIASDTWTHNGAVGLWAYWLRSVDRSGNLSGWHSALPTTATGRLIGAAELQQRFIDESLLLDDLSAQIASIDELSRSYINLALNQDQTSEALAVVRTDVNVLTTETSAIATQVQTIQTSLAGNTAAVQQLAGSIDGIKAEWYVKTQLESADGRRYIAGFGLTAELQGGAPVSEFLVLADRFGIGRPGVTSPVFPFVVMPVDGVPTVVISDAVIGAARIDTAHIRDLAVNGRKIQDFSTSNVAASVGPGFQSVTMTCTGKPVVVLFEGAGWFPMARAPGIEWRSGTRVYQSVDGLNTFGGESQYLDALGPWNSFASSSIVAIELRK